MDHMSISDLTQQATTFGPSHTSLADDVLYLWDADYLVEIHPCAGSRAQLYHFGNSRESASNSLFLVLGALVLVEETELAGDLEDLTLVMDHIVSSHRSRLGTAMLRDRTA
jgi:hypothetical protein